MPIIKTVQQNKESVLDKIRIGKIDSVALSSTNLVDEIMLSMHQNGILSCVKNVIPDKRKPNTTVPFDLILTLATAAKMKVKTALSDVPYAIQDHRLLAELGYNIIDENGIEKGIMAEGQIRHLLEKYESVEFFSYYINAVQNQIIPKLNLSPSIHILDCTKVEVERSNQNYEKSEIVKDDKGRIARGYKLATLTSSNVKIIYTLFFSSNQLFFTDKPMRSSIKPKRIFAPSDKPL
jgi:hypothetical protein